MKLSDLQNVELEISNEELQSKEVNIDLINKLNYIKKLIINNGINMDIAISLEELKSECLGSDVIFTSFTKDYSNINKDFTLNQIDKTLDSILN